MRLVMMGTGPFAVPSYRGLYESGHAVVALVTGPLRPVRGRGPGPASSMRDIAAGQGTPVFDPEDVNSPQANLRLAQFEADLLVVCDYGQILSAETLATTRLGGINVHGSLLPKYRGAAPVNWAVYHGETQTGVSVIHMTPRLDAGPVIAQASTPIGPDETADELETRLAEIGARLVPGAIDSLASGPVEPIPQDSSQASRAPRLKKTDGAIDWGRSAEAIKNQIRALEPWPRAYTFWRRPDGPSVRLILGPVTVAEKRDKTAVGGTVLESSGDRLLVAAGRRALLLGRLQPAGKRMLPVAELLRGYRIKPGERFGPEAES